MRGGRLGVIGLTSAVALFLIGSSGVGAQAGGWQAGPGAALDNTYSGVVDQPGNGASVSGSGQFAVAGWFVDNTAQGWAGADDVQVWLGSMDGGGQKLSSAMFAQPRPDVAAALGNGDWTNSGFVAALSGSAVPSGAQTLYVYAHTPGKGWWFQTVSVTGGAAAGSAPAPAPSAGGAPVLKIANPQPEELVSTKSNYTITGNVADPTNIGIDVWINGERGTKYSVDLGTTTPDAGGNWQVQFTPTHFPSNRNNLYVYATNKVTGQETLASVGFTISDHV